MISKRPINREDRYVRVDGIMVGMSEMKKSLQIILAAVIGVMVHLPAPEPVRGAPPWADKEVLILAASIQMDDAQTSQFQQSVAAFVQNYFGDIRKVMNSRDQANITLRISPK